MRLHRLAYLALFVTSLWLPAYGHHIAVVVHQQNPTKSLTSPELGKIFKAEAKRWPDGAQILVVLNKNSAVSFEILQRISGVPNASARTFVETHKTHFALTDSDEEVLQLVSSMPGAVGMVDVRAVDSRVKVLKIDGRLPLEKAYLPH
ncbi:MAG TPA: substrate-binding domain-containing protein [Candidatus Acidoferrales bacterium]|jgi:ABC-type phosphate transport system substrate-binding protein|nr:substrate-binding domain-containing protein [Candidatus Acidoferrales bacterium]